VPPAIAAHPRGAREYCSIDWAGSASAFRHPCGGLVRTIRSPPVRARLATATGAACHRGATVLLDHAANTVRSLPMRTRTWSGRALDLIVLERIEIDDDANDIGA